jgi:hypothetical protein
VSSAKVVTSTLAAKAFERERFGLLGSIILPSACVFAAGLGPSITPMWFVFFELQCALDASSLDLFVQLIAAPRHLSRFPQK